MPESDLQEVLAGQREIRQKLELLSTPLEDVLANRVVDKARTQIKVWIGVWTAVAVALLGWSGYTIKQAVDHVTSSAQSIVEERATKQVTKDLEDNLQATLARQIQDILATAQSSTDRATRDFLAQLADSNKRLEVLAAAVAQRLNDKQIEETVRHQPIASSEPAFAFYGRLLSGKWVEGPYFRPTAGDSKVLPRTGDDMVATGYVYARKGYVTYVPSQGWINQPAIGVIRPNDRLHVLEAKIIHDGFAWIEFVRQQ